MSSYEPLTQKLAEWFDKPLAELPDDIQELVSTEFFPVTWDKLTAGGRRSIAEQLDCQRDPATAAARQFWFEFYERMHELQAQIADWESKETPTATDKNIQEQRLKGLQQELKQMESQLKKARGDEYPERKRLDETSVSTLSTGDHIAYPKAMRILTEGLGATSEELAAWIFLGPDMGGIAAYRNANELDPPPRFHFDSFMGEDYLSPMMACWFRADDIDQFEPADRYITGAALIERWSRQPGIRPEAFIRAKITESRLLDIHPTFGGTQGTHTEDAGLPPLETGLFRISDIERIEAEDFGNGDNTGQLPPKTRKVAQLDTGNWVLLVQSEAARRWINLRASGANPTKFSIKDDLARWCRENSVKTRTGINPSGEYLYRHALRVWSPPDD